MSGTESKGAPVLVDRAALAGKGLDDFPVFPNPPKGSHGHALAGADIPTRVGVQYDGDVTVQVVEIAGPRTNQVIDCSYDEFIYILEGGLILTPENGTPHEFGAGDSLVMPKGFTGTWENTGDVYRELVVIEKKTWEQDMQRMTVE